MTEEVLLYYVHPSWREWFRASTKFAGCVAEVDKLLPVYALEPPIYKIMKAFMLPLQHLRVLIIGQDPYTTPGMATGLAFSNNTRGDGKYSPSLMNIMQATGTSDPTLMSWVMQGVMLLNTRLTSTSGGTPKDNTHGFWLSLVIDAINHICASLGNKLVIMAWGGEAQNIVSRCFTNGAHVLRWSHPSPLANNRLSIDKAFASCTNFAEANKLLAAPIMWNTKPLQFTRARYIVVTDGACTNNGKPTARASFAYVILRADVREPNRLGLVKFHEDSGLLAATEQQTNNRGELHAILGAIEFLKTQPDLNSSIVAIVTDSAYSIDVCTGNKKAAVNVDLITPIQQFFHRTMTQFDHVGGHQRKPTDPVRELLELTFEGDAYSTFMAEWNHYVDRAATKHL